MTNVEVHSLDHRVRFLSQALAGVSAEEAHQILLEGYAFVFKSLRLLTPDFAELLAEQALSDLTAVVGGAQ